MNHHGPVERNFDALAHPYRRGLLLELFQQLPADSTTARTLRQVNDYEHPRETDHEERYYEHLPKLADYGYISWTKSTGEVAKGSNWQEIRPVLELLWVHQTELPDGWL